MSELAKARPRWWMPPSCPITPLGISGGQWHLIDSLGRHRRLSREDLEDEAVLASLCVGKREWLAEEYPAARLNRNGDMVQLRDTFAYGTFSQHLRAACRVCGEVDLMAFVS